MSTEELLANPGLIAGLGVLLVIQLALMIWSLIDWVKRPDELVRGNKILWLIVIVLGEIIGSVVYLTVGRLPAKVAHVSAERDTSDRAERAADMLYGSPAPAAAAGVSAGYDENDVVPKDDPELGADGTGAGELP
jgi:hypothetical protein